MIQKKSTTYPEAKKKLEHYCAYQERCHWEVEQKLNEFHLITEAREKIIIHLIEHNFLNETRFAQSFARGKFTIKHWGKRRITQELKLRKISTYNIKKALQEIDEEAYLESFSALSEQKWNSLKNETKEKAKQKFISYLQYRGWESHLIFEKLNQLISVSSM
ncbi:regulatory protein RecX [Aquimarina agarivorans]|uniref:regulatory protein RecX n=1 Tax=Aquimarina agarivorans TaxID=980584 RepID=UPI000248EFC8|nr:regulatory protein RecX [Aquimarina agarivorans]